MLTEYLDSICRLNGRENEVYRCAVMPGVTAFICRMHAEDVKLRDLDPGHFEAMLCQSGRIQIRLAGGRIETAGPGDLLLLSRSAQPEELSFSLEPVSFLTVAADKQVPYPSSQKLLPFDFAADMGLLREQMEACGGCLALHDPEWSNSALAALKRLPIQRHGAYFTLRLMERLFVLCSEQPPLQADGKQQYYDTYQKELMGRIHDYILENFEQPITIQQLAREFQISPTRLKEGFRQIYGKPVHAYLQQYRLQKSAQLLCTTTESVLSVANRVGYAGTSRFNAAFREMYGMTPTEYRYLNQE